MIDAIEIEDRIAKCEKILAGDPQSQIFAALADACRKKGDLHRAYEVCAQGLLIYPDYASARIVMAKIQMAKEIYEQAWSELQKAIALSGRTRSTDLLEAEILIRRGEKAEASVIIDRLSQTDPDDENIKRLYELIEKEKTNSVRVPTPIPEDRTAISMDPDAPQRTRSESYRKDVTLSHAVGILKVMPRVLGVLAVAKDGLVLDARFDSSFSKEEFAALAKGVFDSVAQSISRIAMGKTSEILIETRSSKVWIIGRGKFCLVIFARDDVSMGALKLRIDDLFKDEEP
jgi:predicted regulator of Ras-like GTPase activity (Roadblock/LC7/MglB family)